MLVFQVISLKLPFTRNLFRSWCASIHAANYIILFPATTKKTKAALSLLFTKKWPITVDIQAAYILPPHILIFFLYLSQSFIYFGNFTPNATHIYRGNYVE